MKFPEATVKHTPQEDVLAILLGTLFVGLGVTFYSEAQLATGSTAGLALLVQYATGLPFGIVFSIVNAPFYILAFMRMGWPFTLKTFFAVGLVSIYPALMPGWLDISGINPLFAAIAGGALMGMGILAMFRHRASLGGVNILALYLQDNHKIPAGYFQLGVDFCILIAAFFVLPFDRVIMSIIGAFTLSLVIILNHKPGRYMGFS
ncbi:YitT family protein [Pelagibacterium lentulum]|uniref:Membrane protein n=1 Tax=Pelagibacterium lentulum TaxID=2029865 RepID=A0A916VXM3_9HYPH|nr:YitT family protein [Pelagibacterium lentulum]GGA50450.1 membrane protein [Pelagibacterium lentulum]